MLSGKFLLLNIKENQKKIISTEGKYNNPKYTYWAKSKNFLAAAIKWNTAKLFNFEFEEEKEFFFKENIHHVLFLYENTFLIICETEIFKIDGNISGTTMDKIDLEKNPRNILSGILINKNNFLLHVTIFISGSEFYEFRIYNLEGKLVSQTKVSESLW